MLMIPSLLSGVLEPTPISYERALRVALCGTAMDSMVGNELMATYLFHFMQTRGKCIRFISLVEEKI